MSVSIYKTQLGDDWKTHSEKAVRVHLFRPGFLGPYKAPCGYQGTRVTDSKELVTCKTCLNYLEKVGSNAAK